MVKNLRGKLSLQESLAKYTSWQVGGIAKQYYCPADLADLREFLKWLPEAEPIFFLGHGSNVLIRDGGFPGTVIHLYKTFKEITIAQKMLQDKVILRVAAGVSCTVLASFCQQQGLMGAEFYAGIPGSFGGALAMNAGCFASETWSYIDKVETIDRAGILHTRAVKEFTIGYRQVIIPNNEWFVAGYLSLQPGTSSEVQTKIGQLLTIRKQTQPIGELTCGSVFCNPPGLYAAKLIEDCGLKGKMLGKAMVSLKHANFIVNCGGATAKDIEDLINYVQQQVFQQFAVKLTTEVKLVGVY